MRSKEKQAAYDAQWYRNGGQQKKAAYYRALKLEVLRHYGGPRCTCCGETEMAFLTLDHVCNDGKAHRQFGVGTGLRFYRWLKNNDYPQTPILQVLCWNCHMAKGHLGGCPHRKVAVSADED